VAITIREEQDDGRNDVGIEFTLGAGTLVGDTVLLVQSDFFYTLVDLLPPSGTAVASWVEKTGSGIPLDGGTNDNHARVWLGTVTTGGAQTVIVNSTNADNERYATVFVFVGAVEFDGAAGTEVDTTSTSHVAPSLTPTAGQTDDQLVCLWGTAAAVTNYTPPGGMTAYTERDIGGINTHRAASEQLASDAATGTRTATSSANAEWYALSVLVKAGAAGAAPSVVGQPQAMPAWPAGMFPFTDVAGMPSLDFPYQTPWGAEETVSGTAHAVDQTDDAGLTDTSLIEVVKLVEQTDSAGLLDAVIIDQSKVFTDSAGLTDPTAFTQAKEVTDSAGLTDTSAVELSKLVTQTDAVGLTDTRAFTVAPIFTDSSGLTDARLIEQSKAITDSAGLTDTTVIESGKVVDQTDSVGLTDTQAFSQSKIQTDSAGLTDSAFLTISKVQTDSAGLTDVASAGLLRDVTNTDLVGLADAVVLSRAAVLTDLVGLADATALQQFRILTDSVGLTDDADVTTVIPVPPFVDRPASGFVDRPASTTVNRPLSTTVTRP
jgi:hypothetical protein